MPILPISSARRGNGAMLLPALCALLLLLALASVCLGSVRVPLRDVLSAL